MIVLASLAFVCLVLALAHSGPGSGHMGDDGMQGGQLVLMCMAVVAAGVALLAAATGILPAGRPRAPRHLRPTGLSRALAERLLIPASPRAGPAILQVFRR